MIQRVDHPAHHPFHLRVRSLRRLGRTGHRLEGFPRVWREASLGKGRLGEGVEQLATRRRRERFPLLRLPVELRDGFAREAPRGVLLALRRGRALLVAAEIDDVVCRLGRAARRAAAANRRAIHGRRKVGVTLALLTHHLAMDVVGVRVTV